MAHLTCVGHDRDEIAAILDHLDSCGIENVLPLRGDPPQGETTFVRPPNGFGYASELVRFIRERGYRFCLGGAGYPEGHQECRDLARDIEHLRQKVAAGVDFVITQLFYDNADYFAFVARARGDRHRRCRWCPASCRSPTSPRSSASRACAVRASPTALREQLHAAEGDDAAVQAIGIEYATRQCRELLAGGAPGIHFYTLNQSPATAAILAELRR